jgi:low temperature requirement protein LtrA
MVAGIIVVAAADEFIVAHPGQPGTPASVALTLGGTALFLAGHELFQRAVLAERPSNSGLRRWARYGAIRSASCSCPR